VAKQPFVPNTDCQGHPSGFMVRADARGRFPGTHDLEREFRGELNQSWSRRADDLPKMDAIIHFAVYRSSFVSVMSKLLIPGPWKNRRGTFPRDPYQWR
jgi:hypothetical protein